MCHSIVLLLCCGVVLLCCVNVLLCCFVSMCYCVVLLCYCVVVLCHCVVLWSGIVLCCTDVLLCYCVVLLCIGLFCNIVIWLWDVCTLVYLLCKFVCWRYSGGEVATCALHVIAQWSLYVPTVVVTICTVSLTFINSTFCPHSVFMCFVWIWEQTAIISLYNITVYCSVRTFQRLNYVIKRQKTPNTVQTIPK
jgi:hypothetical protein